MLFIAGEGRRWAVRVNCRFEMPPIIEVDNVVKTYRIGKVDVPAVRGVSFNVEPGEFISIVGPSGNHRASANVLHRSTRLCAGFASG